MTAPADEVSDIINVTSILCTTGATASVVAGTLITLAEGDATVFATVPLAANSSDSIYPDTALDGIELDAIPVGAEITIFHR
jgi:hypothetical protein